VSLITLANGGFSPEVAPEVARSAHLPGLDQATADRLVDTTHQVCPYSNAPPGEHLGHPQGKDLSSG